MPDTPAPEQSHFRFPTLSILLWLSGGAALFFSSHSKLISAAAAAIGGVLWTAFVGLTSKIWARAEKTIVELVGDALDIYIRDFASRYRKRYLEHLQQRHRTFDVKGLSTQGIYALEIEQVYVELTVDPTLAGKASSNPIAKIEPGRHDIWTFLSSPQMKQQDFAILGAPGSGKTTLLKHITLGLAANGGKYRGIKRLPVLVFIRDHVASIAAAPEKTIAEIVEEATNKMGIPSPAGWFGRELARGRCLVMLDGLDEVADSNLRKTVAEWAEKQLPAFGANRFLISSRPFGYKSNPLGNVTVLEVRPFSSEQSERFIKNWYLANEIMSAQKNDEGVQIAAREGATDLLKRIHSAPALAELAVNPLLLTMIANVHRYRSSLPGRRVELYAEICEVFLGKRQQARGMELDLTPAQKKRILQPLAFHMMCEEKREIPLPEAVQVIQAPLALVNDKIRSVDFLRDVENSSGLLLERENSVYSFAHLTFQEYLAASYAVEQKREQELLERVGFAWWHEVIRLFVASTDATGIIEACIKDDKVEVLKLTLAVECLEDALAVRPDLRSKVHSIVIAGLEDSSRERARLAAETKLALRLRHLARIDDDTYVDKALITCSEYQLFIDEQGAFGRYRRPDHWQSTHFSLGSALRPILGVRPSDAEEFCRWLSNRQNENWSYQIPEDDLGDQLHDGAGYWVSAKEPRLSYVSHSGPLLELGFVQVALRRDRLLCSTIASGAYDSYTFDFAVRRIKALVPELRLVDTALDHLLKSFAELDPVFSPSPISFLAIDHILAFIRDLTQRFGLDSDFERAIDAALSRDGSYHQGRAICRCLLLLSMVFFSNTFSHEPRWYSRFIRRQRRPLSATSSSPLIVGLMRIYIGLVALEARIEGRISAFEGIRIMKVRKNELAEKAGAAKLAP